MSNQMNTPPNRHAIRWQLLSSASALALMASLYGAGRASAAGSDEDHPMLWIELGGQAEAITGQGDPFTAPFVTTQADSPVFKPLSPIEVQKPPRYSFGEEAKISFQPDGTNWVFSASIRYGRSANHRDIHQQTKGLKFPTTTILYQNPYAHAEFPSAANKNYAQYKSQHGESHEILDFQVGKDVALGLLGKDASSIVNIGVRVAQFTVKAATDIHARPNISFYGFLPLKYWHDYGLSGHNERSFRGVGPLLSWNGSVPVVGDTSDGEMTLDWGVNAALLFGRQKTIVHHQTSAKMFHQLHSPQYVTIYQHTVDHLRSRSVTVPNFGGFAGVSYRLTNVALSIGYRADYFSGAVDSGIDAAKKTTLNFNGPYASVSIGVGD